MSLARGRELVSADHPDLSIARQCELLGISRSGFYYAPAGESEINLALMRRMGLAAVYQRPRTSISHPEHVVFPYLLRGMAIDRGNQVWCADITYIPMRRGFLYLVAVMDWASRKLLSWRVSNTMETDFCIVAVADAMQRFGAPEIFNTDQGSQFTSSRFVSLLQDAGISVSMDGRGRWMDNVFIERLWRSLKYECVYLHAFETTSELRAGLTAWVGLYNERRPHSALGGQTPDEVYGRASCPAAGPACPPAGTQARQRDTMKQAA